MAAAPRKSAVRFQERAELLDFLLDVSAATSETLDLERILANVASAVKEVVPYDLFAILLYSERRGGLSIRYAIGHREEIIRSLTLPLGEGITGIAASTRQPILVSDVHSDPRYLSALDAVQSELAVPMLARGKLVGVIDLQSTRLDAYREQDRALLQLIASRVAVAIDNARLYRRVDRQNKTLKTLSHLSQEFSSILDLDELLGKIVKIVHALVAFDAFSILLVDPAQKVLRHRFSQRYDQRVNLDNIPLGRGLTGAAAESREIVRVTDTLTDPRYIASHPDIRSEIAVPLVVQDRAVGVMDLESEKIGYFTEDHARLLALLAPQIASSVENARLYEELAQREQRMEQDLKAARNVQSVLLLREAPPIKGLEIAIRARPAREITGDVYDIFEHGNDACVRVRRRERQRRGRGALRRHGQRAAAHAGSPHAQPGGTAAAAQQRAARARRGGAVCHAAGAGLGARAPPFRHGQCGRRAAPHLPARRDPQAAGRKVFRRDCWTTASTKKWSSMPSPAI